MNKLKELWGKNKVLIVLGMILVACFIAILIVTISFFLGGNKEARQKSTVEFSATDRSNYITSLENDKAVEKVTIDFNSQTIIATVKFVGDTPLEDAKSKASASLSSFSEEILNAYDVNFIIKSDKTENSEGFRLTGARNVAGSGLVWSNNTQVESEE